MSDGTLDALGQTAAMADLFVLCALLRATSKPGNSEPPKVHSTDSSGISFPWTFVLILGFSFGS